MVLMRNFFVIYSSGIIILFFVNGNCSDIKFVVCYMGDGISICIVVRF